MSPIAIVDADDLEYAGMGEGSPSTLATGVARLSISAQTRFYAERLKRGLLDSVFPLAGSNRCMRFMLKHSGILVRGCGSDSGSTVAHRLVGPISK